MPTTTNDLLGYELEDWMPMEPAKGPPLPKHLEIYWPWYKPPAAEFRVSNLIISPLEVNPGQVVTISVKVTNIGTQAGDYTVKLGGDFTGEESLTLEPTESRTISFEAVPDVAKTYHISVDGLTGTFRATEAPVEIVDFELARPAVAPAEVTPGTAITVTCPVTSRCSTPQTTTVKVIIYEGSILPGHGSVIATKTSPSFSISPGETYNVIVHHTAVAGTIDRRDIQVEVYIAGRLVKESEWDDVYYVSVPPPPPPPRGNLTVTRFSIPGSAKGGTTVQGSLTYQVTGYVEWAKLYVTSYGSSRETPLLTTPGTYTMPISVYQPRNGYSYHRVTIVIYGGVLYEWSGWFFSKEVKIYLEE